MSAWKPSDRPADEPHHAHQPHHHHDRHHHRTIGVGKVHAPPHVETHAGIAHTSEQIVRVESKVDALFEMMRAHLTATTGTSN